jgi:hypothetical protein
MTHSICMIASYRDDSLHSTEHSARGEAALVHPPDILIQFGVYLHSFSCAAEQAPDFSSVTPVG